MPQTSTTELVGVEIFGAGTWKGRVFTESHLDEMVANFPKIQKHHAAPVKLGHSDKQVIAQKDGQPALGWIKNLYRKGKKLLADITQVPKVMVDAIKAGRYRTISAEIYPTFEATNSEKNLKTGVKGHVLSAIAFLGADIPEVSTLQDLATVLASEGDVPFVFDDAPAGEAESFEMTDDEPADSRDTELHIHYDADDEPMTFIIRKSGDEWVLYDHTGEKVLGRHKSRESAVAQERAIQARKHMGEDGDTAVIHTQVTVETDPVGSTSTANTGTDMSEKETEKEVTPKDDERLLELQTQLATAEGKIQASESESEALKARVEAAEKRQAAAERKALEAEATQFVSKYRQPDCLKIFNDEQAAMVRTLYCQKASEVVKMSDKDGKEADVSIAALLGKFLDAQPDQKVLLTEVTKDTPAEQRPETFMEAVQAIIEREKLDATEDFDQAVQLAMREKPHLYNYGTGEQQGS